MRGPITIVTLVLLFLAIVGLQALQSRREPLGLPAGVSTNLLYVRSPEFMKRAALSFDALAADVYWIRTVQHYGGTKLSKDPHKQYDVLYPLLDLTTSLDPYFDVAYRFGSVFLGEKFPSGAGRPDQAIALLQKGMRVRPQNWELARDTGFVYYWWLHDYQTAGAWFDRAAGMPNAPNWMKALAAVTLAQGGNRATSRQLWTEMAGNTDADWLRDQARFRLTQLDAMDQIDLLEHLVQQYQSRTGSLPGSWLEIVRAGLIRGFPVDSSGHVFQLDASSGKVTLAPESPLNPLPDPDHPA